MYRCAPNLDRDDRIQGTHGRFKWREEMVLVGEDPEVAWLYAETYTCGYVLFGGFEPGISLRLLEDVVEDGIVCVVIHPGCLQSICSADRERE